MAGALKQKERNEETSKAVCGRLNTAAFTDGLGRVRIADGAGRAMVAKSERDRIRDLDLTPLCLLTLDNFEDDVHHNKCRSIFLGYDHDAEEDGEKVFLHYIVEPCAVGALLRCVLITELPLAGSALLLLQLSLGVTNLRVV